MCHVCVCVCVCVCVYVMVQVEDAYRDGRVKDLPSLRNDKNMRNTDDIVARCVLRSVSCVHVCVHACVSLLCDVCLSYVMCVSLLCDM